MDKPRTLDEIKNDIRSRVGHRSPFNHADKQEAEEALAQLTSVDGETWASAWNELGARYEEKACKAERYIFAERFVKEGWGCFVLDSPGTGECPMLASPDAHQVYVAALTYLTNRPEVNANRLAVVGASFGGYWATKLAHVEPERL